MLDILLSDISTEKNIVWATSAYGANGYGYEPENQIESKLITGNHLGVIKTRAEKATEEQASLTRSFAEVFTPTWMCKLMIDEADSENGWGNLTDVKEIRCYIKSTRLEITCGEAPFIVNRYDASDGSYIPVPERIGILDRKLRLVKKITDRRDSWKKWATVSLKSVYGYEYQGDNLFIARLNILKSIEEAIEDAGYKPLQKLELKTLAKIIIKNFWQMDGLNYCVPFKALGETFDQSTLWDLCDMDTDEPTIEQYENVFSRIYDWANDKELEFRDIAKGWAKMKFDFVIGNPPYQEDRKGTSKTALPIYHQFIDGCQGVSDVIELITPARFLFNAGRTPKEWNQKMLNDEHLKVVEYEPDGSKIFPNTEIKGGVVITYWDEKKDFGAIEVFTIYPEMNNVLKKVLPYVRTSSFKDLGFVASKFDINNLVEDYEQYSGHERRMSSNVLSFECFHGSPEADDVCVYGIYNKKRNKRYINSRYVDSTDSNLNQYKVVIPKADGNGAAQVRTDAGKTANDSVKFCVTPQGAPDKGTALLNAGAQTINDSRVATNEPHICGWVPPTPKKVIGESSQGGDQEDINGKIVFPGQKVEYTLTSQDTIPTLTEQITSVQLTDTYDKNLTPDLQTVEITDLKNGVQVSKKNWTLSHDKKKHTFTVVFKNDYIAKTFKAGELYRFQLRFEGTVNKDAPKVAIDNEWVLKINNELVPSNKVTNQPADPHPVKSDETKAGITIDGKTVYYGDPIYYRLTLDAAKLTDTAYKVQRLGMVDDYDDEYLNLIENEIEVLDHNGQDVTDKFNIQVKDGIAYVFFKTVDTEYLDTVLKGDPQPTDLKTYSEMALDPKTQPSIDQNVLGQTYTIVLPMKVAKVTDGYTVKNTATQITNDRKDVTNTVSNPLKEINPKKDVTVNVNGDSANGKSIYKEHQFLYRLDSSQITKNRAYQQIRNWKIVDNYDETYDQVTGQWAVYANNDYTDANGTVIIKQGQRIDGSGVDAGYFTFTNKDGVFVIEATQKFLDIASAMDADLSWTGYVQMTRIAVSDRVENQFIETMNDVERESNLVWTKTPDQTPAIKLIKYDKESGLEQGDRNTPEDALKNTKNGTVIVFRIINTGAVDLTKITLTDKTVAGSGEVTDLQYPQGWDNLILKPGAYVEVTGTLTNMSGINHTNRGTTTGTPIVPCVVKNDHPFDTPTDTNSDKDDNEEPTTPTDGDTDKNDTDSESESSESNVCFDTPISASDDWNGVAALIPTMPLAETGSAITGLAALTVLVTAAGITLTMQRRRHAAHKADKEDTIIR
ncbi:LPXTG cell wall anchor domain-containing protein [Alloscardovia criceti]|uniref:LPXTG cell wall anchor domain-containing protein n=1 Tax=Alloscardovia criceti TaxID=356828 RepID=UPI0012EAC9EF|nr:LPXTG cell wall anchor domain-containing protein [Alloscardovia criceti]